MVEADEQGYAEVVETRLPVLVDLCAEWCEPCRIMAPTAGRPKAVEVEVESAPAISTRLGVKGIPTLVVLRHSTEVARQVGALPGDRPAARLDGRVGVEGAAGGQVVAWTGPQRVDAL